MGFGSEPAKAFLAQYAAHANEPVEVFWLVLDAVGFLAAPGEEPLFGSPAELHRLDAWVQAAQRDPRSSVGRRLDTELVDNRR